MAFHVGLGSWADDAYVGVLYPPGLPKAERLREYARSFGQVEVNSSYYATPASSVVRRWMKQTPPTFTFSVKLHRAFAQVTHPTQAYLRLHGRNPRYLEAESAVEGHTYSYASREVASLARRVRALGRDAREVYVIANNHARDFAPKTALALAALLERRR